MNTLIKTISLITFLACSGCALSPTARYTEATWQAITVVDMGQTVQISRQPTEWREVDPTTSRIIGSHPTTANVYEFFASYMAFHYTVTALLDHADKGSGFWHAVSLMWQGGMLGSEGETVAHNFHIGLEPWTTSQFSGDKHGMSKGVSK